MRLPAFTADPRGLFESCGHKWRAQAANMFGVRRTLADPDHYVDLVGVAWESQDGVRSIAVRGTTNPSGHYLQHPIDGEGTLIVKPGQYDRVWQVRDEYGRDVEYKDEPALLQYGYTPFTFYVDDDHDREIDLDGTEVSGWKGVHFHRPFGDGVTTGLATAACQLAADVRDTRAIVGVVRAMPSALGPEQGTGRQAFADYTLFTEEQVNVFNGSA